ncbi:MAG: hypothetical protein IJA73_02650 [Oscillospiraceae bacterium]|nr:hypothetical protein [Oscillospiraceae bacterium]
MTALIVLGILLLLILLVLYIRVGVLVCFGEETTFTIVVGPFKKSLAKKDSAKKTKKKEKGASSQKAKPKKHLPRPTKDEIFSLIGAVRAALSKALLKTRGRIRIAPLDVSVCFGGEDKAKTTQTYGLANAVCAAVMPKARTLLSIPRNDIRFSLDFERAETTASGTVGVSIRPIHVLIIAFALAKPLVCWFMAFRKAHKDDAPPRPAEEKIVTNDAAA